MIPQGISPVSLKILHENEPYSTGKSGVGLGKCFLCCRPYRQANIFSLEARLRSPQTLGWLGFFVASRSPKLQWNKTHRASVRPLIACMMCLNFYPRRIFSDRDHVCFAGIYVSQIVLRATNTRLAYTSKVRGTCVSRVLF